MTENQYQPDSEKLALIHASHLVTSVADLQTVGDPEALLPQIGLQVSQQIADYNAAHAKIVEFQSGRGHQLVTGHEMLPKTPAEIVAQFLAGRSQVILAPDGQVLYHGTIYQNFSPALAKFLGFQVVEFGTVITHDGFRGFGLGKDGVQKGLERVTIENHNPISLSTIKRPDMASVFLRVGKSVIPFVDYPYLSYLTCTCDNCSESHGFTACPFRRSPSLSSNEVLRSEIAGRPVDPLACTLLISNLERAAAFEARCRDLDTQIQGSCLSGGIITPESMAHAHNFFARVEAYAKP